MSKRGMGDDFEQQAGNYQDGFTSDNSNSGNPFAGNNLGGSGIAGRKILKPRRLGGARPVTPKPMPPQPQAQAQPVSANTQGFGFTFGGGPAPAASSGGFNFGSQQSSGMGFGSQASAPMAQSSGFSNTPVNNNPFQSTPSDPAQASTPGFQGSIFNIQPTNAPAPKPFTSFGGFGNQPNSQPGNNMFGAQQSQQPKQDFVFGQTANSNTGFGSGSQSVSAPSSFSFGNDNTASIGQPAAASPAPFAFGTSSQQSAAPSTNTTQPTSTFTFGASAPAAQNSIFSVTSQPGASDQQASTTATTSASQPSSMFSFGAKSSRISNPFAAATKPQAEETSKAPSFSFGGSTASSAPSIFSTVATTGSAVGGSIFKTSEPSTSTTSNIFASSASQPTSTTATSGFSSNQDTAKQSTNIFSGLASATSSAPTASLFGSPASNAGTTQDVANDTKPSTVGTAATSTKPLFNFKPATVQDGSETDDAEKTPTEPKKAPFFGMSMSTSAAETPTVQQKALPTFSFDSSKIGSASTPFKPGDTAQTDGGKPRESGLFSSTSSSASQFQPSQKTGSSSTTSEVAKDTTQPLFKVNPSNSMFQTSPDKPLFSMAGNSTPNIFSQPSSGPSEKAIPTDTASSASSKPLFGLPKNVNLDGVASDSAVSGQKLQESIPQGKSLFGISSANPVASDAQPKPSFMFQPSTDKASEEAAVKPAFSFGSTINVQQQVSPKKPSANLNLAPQHQQQINGDNTANLATEARPTVPALPESTSIAENENTSIVEADHDMLDASQAPDDATIPESFVAKWNKLRSDDLPTEEVVDILLHDWILQLEIPRSALTGMDMNQEDDLTWLWQQSAVDAAWDYHIRTWGSKDRNLMEIYRMIITLKTEIDRFHKKTWSKSDTLVNPKIFEERYIRKMAKRNIENWETGLKSEIKNLKKRKIDTTRDADQGDMESANTAKRNKTGDTSRTDTTSKASAVPAFQQPAQNLFSRQITENEAPKNFARFGEKTRAESSPAKDANTSDVTRAASSTSDARSDGSNIFGATKPLLFQESPSKTGLFSSSTRTSDETSSPQRSKTSQLFASIANKPTEDVPVKAAPPAAGKSLFDRITRDSTGAPVREVSGEPLFVPQEDGEGEDDNQEEELDDYEEDEDEDDEEDDEEEEENTTGAEVETHADGESDDEEDNDKSNEKAVAEQSKPGNIFSQSSSTVAGAIETSPSANRDHTWKPDSPIKFSKDKDTTPAVSKPPMGFVPKEGMPAATAVSAAPLSQGAWQAPANPFGNFKNVNKKSDSEKKPDTETTAAPKFAVPKPPANLNPSENLPVSTNETWKAPSNPFGLFKKVDEGSAATSSSTPALTITAPSPQRPAKPLFDMTSSTTKPTEQPKSLFGFSNPQPSSDTISSEKATQPPSLFSFSSASSIKNTSEPTESTAPKKPLFEFTKSEPSNNDATPLPSNHWLDFAKGINKPASPAPSGASVFASLTTSLNPSRASSPAMSAVSTIGGDTDAEHHDDDEAPKEAQLDLGSTTAGEENEEALQTVRAKAYEFCSVGDGPKEWTVRGVGELRVLKDKETSKVRAVLRADQSAKVLLNAGLIPSASYNLKTPKRVNFTVASADGIPSAWFIQVSKEEDAKKLSELFEANKPN